MAGNNHQERLEHFYDGQAKGYDSFREKLLTNRQELIDSLPIEAGQRVLDVGGGTGRNLEFFGEKIQEFEQATVLDLCRPLLDQAQQRVEHHGWTNVDTVCADATTWRAEQPRDITTFSYALTMIPDWFAAFDNAIQNTKPGGIVAVVDFHLSRKHANEGWAQHGYFRRHFWPGGLVMTTFSCAMTCCAINNRLQDCQIFEGSARARVHAIQSPGDAGLGADHKRLLHRRRLLVNAASLASITAFRQ